MGLAFPEEAYQASCTATLPMGRAWRTEIGSVRYRLLQPLSVALATFSQRVDTLFFTERLPWAAVELLPAWEKSLGLPDDCAPTDQTLRERQQAVQSKLQRRGGASQPYFKQIAATLGYDVEITRSQPFICGLSQCGGTHEIGGSDLWFVWRVKVPGPRVTYFECGRSICGVDAMASFRQAEDLECVFRKIEPAYSTLIFSYEGTI